MLVILLAFIIGAPIGWYSFAYRGYFATIMAAFASVGLVLLIAPIGPLVRQAAITYDMSILEVVKTLYWGLLPDPLEPMVPWLLFFIVAAHAVSLVVIKGFEPEATAPETRADSRRRVRADMKYSDDYFD